MSNQTNFFENNGAQTTDLKEGFLESLNPELEKKRIEVFSKPSAFVTIRKFDEIFGKREWPVVLNQDNATGYKSIGCTQEELDLFKQHPELPAITDNPILSGGSKLTKEGHVMSSFWIVLVPSQECWE
jgi:hypothetical protein